MTEAKRSQEPVERQASEAAGVGMIPRGIEVLVKKAAVDADFRRLLLEQRSDAAAAIGLVLQPSEAMLLRQIPAEQLELIIASTYVEPTKIPAFLGRVAAAMILAISAGAGVTAAQNAQIVEGIRINKSPATSSVPASAPSQGEPNGRVEVVYGIRRQVPATQPTTTDANVAVERPGWAAPTPASMPAIDTATLTKLIAQLDSENAGERTVAHQKILDLGKGVVPHLRQVRQGSKLSPEASVRIDSIIEKLAGSQTPTGWDRPPIDLDVAGARAN